MKSRWVRTVAAVATAGVMVAGCSRGSDESTGEAAGSDQKVVKIGVVVPLTDKLSAFGLGIKNSVDLAVNEANKSGKLPGWKLVLAPEDDAGKPDTGAAAANKLASDQTVAGVIGTYNSSVAQQVAPILQRAKIAQISPANTSPSLTRGPDDANPKRVWDNYFRVCANDAAQGPFAADYAYGTAGLKTVVTVNDKKTYGQGITQTFEGEFEKLGGKILSRETVSEGDRDFGALVAKITAAKPDFVFYGGEYPAAAPLSAQLGQGGFKGPLMGGDGIQSAEYATGGGRDGDLATTVGAPIAKLSAAKSFTDAYQAAGYKDPFEAYGPLAYDAANILIDAVAKVLPGAGDVSSARPKVIEQLAKTADFQGVSGTTSFDQFGDTSNKVLTVYQVGGKAWKDTYTGTFEPKKEQ